MGIIAHMRGSKDGREKMKKKKKIAGKTTYRTSSKDVYDTEVRCAQCGFRLYVSPEGAILVQASLRHIGMAGLICLCGHTQLIDAGLRPLIMPMPSSRNNERTHVFDCPVKDTALLTNCWSRSVLSKHGWSRKIGYADLAALLEIGGFLADPMLITEKREGQEKA